MSVYLGLGPSHLLSGLPAENSIWTHILCWVRERCQVRPSDRHHFQLTFLVTFHTRKLIWRQSQSEGGELCCTGVGQGVEVSDKTVLYSGICELWDGAARSRVCWRWLELTRTSSESTGVIGPVTTSTYHPATNITAGPVRHKQNRKKNYTLRVPDNW